MSGLAKFQSLNFDWASCFLQYSYVAHVIVDDIYQLVPLGQSFPPSTFRIGSFNSPVVIRSIIGGQYCPGHSENSSKHLIRIYWHICHIKRDISNCVNLITPAPNESLHKYGGGGGGGVVLALLVLNVLKYNGTGSISLKIGYLHEFYFARSMLWATGVSNLPCEIWQFSFAFFSKF